MRCWGIVEVNYRPVFFWGVALISLGLGALAACIIFGANAGNWRLEQSDCVAARTRDLTCLITGENFEINGTENRVFYDGFIENTNTPVKLYPDCRFIIREDYTASDDQWEVLQLNQTIGCWFDPASPDPSVGIYTTTIWDSNISSLGWKASLGVGLGVLVLGIGVFALIYKTCTEGSENIRWEEIDDSYSDVCCGRHCNFFNFFRFHCTLNPIYCVKFCVPLWWIFKLVLTGIVFVIIVVGVLIYVYITSPSSTRSCRYSACI